MPYQRLNAMNRAYQWSAAPGVRRQEQRTMGSGLGLHAGLTPQQRMGLRIASQQGTMGDFLQQHQHLASLLGRGAGRMYQRDPMLGGSGGITANLFGPSSGVMHMTPNAGSAAFNRAFVGAYSPELRPMFNSAQGGGLGSPTLLQSYTPQMSRWLLPRAEGSAW